MKKKEELSLSFNVTKRCGNSCKHCYRTAFNEKEADLSIDLFKIILDDLKRFEEKYFVNFNNLSLVGGDPLLHKNWKQLLLELKKRKKKFAILGNPETLSEDNVKFLKDLNISSFQLSLDGLKKTHDYCRYQGSFDKTFEKIDLLNKYDIPINITFSLFPYNSKNLLDLMDLLVEKNIAVKFFLSLGRNMGNAKSFDKVFSKKDLKEIIEKFLDKIKETEKTNCKTSFSTTTAAFPCHLGDGNKYNNLTMSYLVSGCGLGFGMPRFMTDGSLVACPFMTKSIGKIPEKTFEDIFLGNVLMRKYRRREFFLGCRNCSYYLSCRGCPAITYSEKKRCIWKISFM